MFVIYQQSPDMNAVRTAAGGQNMLRTITVGTCVSVQGTFVRQLDNGKIVVRVGERDYAGAAVGTKVA